MRKGATTPARQDLGDAGAARPGDVRGQRAGRGTSPIWTTAEARSEARTTPRTTSPAAKGQSHSSRCSGLGKEAVLQQARRRAARSRARGGRGRAGPSRSARTAARCIVGVERRVDAQAALVDALAAVLPLQVLAHLLEEVRGDRGRLPAQVQAERLALGRLGLLAR